MNVSRDQLCLYAITDRKWLTGERTLSQAVEQALQGGATIIQLREKHISQNDFEELAKEIHAVTQSWNVPLIINDNVDVMLTVGAEGVHIGQDDGNVKKVREQIGPDRILGVSARTLEQAIQAEKDGADYLGCGAVFGTTTKTDAEHISIETLQQICNTVRIPVVAIGGINADNMNELRHSGIAGIAVISAIFAKSDVKEAAMQLRHNMQNILPENQ